VTEEHNAALLELGDLLREAREAKQLTQTAAAERADISRTMWQQLEAGARNDGKPLRPRPETVVNAAVAVGVDPQRALRLAGLDPNRYEPPTRGAATVSQREVADLFTRLNGRQRQALLELLQALVEPGEHPGWRDQRGEPFGSGDVGFVTDDGVQLDLPTTPYVGDERASNGS
jgi:transcriptional regulator with XRE-family HTH domain